MSDLQCPARFRLVMEGSPCAQGVPRRLNPATQDPTGELEALADLHRGERVDVVVPMAVAARLPAVLRPPAGGELHVEVDADGWRRLA